LTAFDSTHISSFNPYGMVGAIIALWIMSAPFDFSVPGCEEALLDAGSRGSGPVLITVGATVFALMPPALHGRPLRERRGYAHIGGLTVATVITLILVLVFYSIAVLDLKAIRWEGRQ
jgi:multidrug efflux pump subunit AcrB